MDARRLKSRAKLREALSELLQNQPLEEISIEQVTERAGVTRPTFYSNYESRQDIINEHVKQWIDKRQSLFDDYLADAQPPGHERLRSLIEHMLLTIDPNDLILRLALSGRAGDVALQMVRNQHTDFFRRRAEQGLTKPVTPEQLHLITTFYSSATMGVIVEILNKRLPYDPATLAEQVSAMIYQGIQHLIAVPAE